MKCPDLYLAIAGFTQILQHFKLRVGPVMAQFYCARAQHDASHERDWQDDFFVMFLPLLRLWDRAGWRSCGKNHGVWRLSEARRLLSKRTSSVHNRAATGL